MYAELEQKECRQCRGFKSLKLFRLRQKKGRRDSYESYCKQCEKENNKKFFLKNRELLRHRDYVRNCKKFGLSAEAYEQMVKDQNGACAVCEKPEIRTRGGKIKKLAIDHDHKTGKVRALLCCDCNTSLGLMEENPDRLRSLIRYIEKFKK